MLLANEEGIRVQGGVVNLAAIGNLNAVAVFTLPALAGILVGTKSIRILKVRLINWAAGNDTVHIGTGIGAAFNDLIPALYSANGLDDDFVDLPKAEAFATITAWPTALPGGGNIDIMLEVIIVG